MSVLLLTAETMGKDSKYCSIHMSDKTTKIKQLSLRLHLWYLLVSFQKTFFCKILVKKTQGAAYLQVHIIR